MGLTTIIFDADHTLYTPESEEAYNAKFTYLSRSTGRDTAKIRHAWEQTVKEIRQSSDPGEWERKKLIRDALERIGITPDEGTVEEAYSIFWESVANNTRSVDGVAGMLRQLRNDGFNLAIATDEFPEPLRMKLSAVLHTTEIDDLFDVIVTPQDTGKQKPSEQFYRIVMDELNVFASDTMMIGDSWVRDLAPAKKLGITTVLLDSDHDTPGTSQEQVSDMPEVELETSAGDGEPDHTLGSITDLIHLLNEVDAL